MLPGDVILEPPADAWGRLVASVDGARYCHVRIMGADSAASAEDAGIVWEDRIFEGDLAISPPLTDEQRSKIQDELVPLIGRPYSRLGLVALGLARVGVKLPLLSREIPDPSAFICSQLAAHTWRRVGFDPFPGRPSQTITPGDLADVALREGWPVYTP
jgi:hypothetical protein